MVIKLRKMPLLLSLIFLTACASPPPLYQAIGGHSKIEEITDHFITQIEYSEDIFPYFQAADVERFREKFIEHLCAHTDGPCEYTGDSMQQVHDGMNINERDFNTTVDLLVKAMEASGLDYPLQNKILHRLAPTRGDMIYR